MFTNRWPPQKEGADSFTRVLGGTSVRVRSVWVIGNTWPTQVALMVLAALVPPYDQVDQSDDECCDEDNPPGNGTTLEDWERVARAWGGGEPSVEDEFISRVGTS